LDWYNPQIHLREFLKWANGDTVRQLITTNRRWCHCSKQHFARDPPSDATGTAEPSQDHVCARRPIVGDPQVRQAFDRSAGLPPGDPSMTPPVSDGRESASRDLATGQRWREWSGAITNRRP